MKPVSQTTFLEAVAAAIQHEKKCFDYYMKVYEELNDGGVRDLFYQMAGDVEENIRIIQTIYTKAEAGEGFPNLKFLGAVHKFHATSIQKVMEKLDRNLAKSPAGSELEAIRLALQEGEDARTFFGKIGDKFNDPNVKLLFQQMAAFNDERQELLQYVLSRPSDSPREPYWEDDSLMSEGV